LFQYLAQIEHSDLKWQQMIWCRAWFHHLRAKLNTITVKSTLRLTQILVSVVVGEMSYRSSIQWA
jgi:hypothetical protein